MTTTTENQTLLIESSLKKVPFFSYLNQDQLADLARHCHLQEAVAGSLIMREGEAGDRMYMLASGHVRLFRRDNQGHEVELATLAGGDYFGELALMDAGPRPASALALVDCMLVTLDQMPFTALLLKSRAHLVFRVFATLAESVRSTSDRFFQQELASHRLKADMELERHRALTQMVAGVAHELNTPLGISNTAVDIIRRRLEMDAVNSIRPRCCSWT